MKRYIPLYILCISTCAMSLQAVESSLFDPVIDRPGEQSRETEILQDRKRETMEKMDEMRHNTEMFQQKHTIDQETAATKIDTEPKGLFQKFKSWINDVLSIPKTRTVKMNIHANNIDQATGEIFEKLKPKTQLNMLNDYIDELRTQSYADINNHKNTRLEQENQHNKKYGQKVAQYRELQQKSVTKIYQDILNNHASILNKLSPEAKLAFQNPTSLQGQRFFDNSTNLFNVEKIIKDNEPNSVAAKEITKLVDDRIKITRDHSNNMQNAESNHLSADQKTIDNFHDKIDSIIEKLSPYTPKDVELKYNEKTKQFEYYPKNTVASSVVSDTFAAPKEQTTSPDAIRKATIDAETPITITSQPVYPRSPLQEAIQQSMQTAEMLINNPSSNLDELEKQLEEQIAKLTQESEKLSYTASNETLRNNIEKTLHKLQYKYYTVSKANNASELMPKTTINAPFSETPIKDEETTPTPSALAPQQPGYANWEDQLKEFNTQSKQSPATFDDILSNFND